MYWLHDGFYCMMKLRSMCTPKFRTVCMYCTQLSQLVLFVIFLTQKININCLGRDRATVLRQWAQPSPLIKCSPKRAQSLFLFVCSCSSECEGFVPRSLDPSCTHHATILGRCMYVCSLYLVLTYLDPDLTVRVNNGSPQAGHTRVGFLMLMLSICRRLAVNIFSIHLSSSPLS